LGHGIAIDGDGVGFVGFDVVAAARAAEDQINREVDEADGGRADDVEQCFNAVDVDAAGHVGGELARFELARAFGIQHRGELVAVEEAWSP
jgi:hypothetical protein